MRDIQGELVRMNIKQIFVLEQVNIEVNVLNISFINKFVNAHLSKIYI